MHSRLRFIPLAAAAALLVSGCSMTGIKFAHSGAGTTSALEETSKVAATSEAVAASVAIADPTPAADALAYSAPGNPRLDGLIAQYATYYQVPEALVRRVIVRESKYNPQARNGPYYGLMQIRHQTAQTMGYSGSANGLLDAETNLKYAVKYLRGAYLVARGNPDQAVRFYASGYYYDAKRMGLLKETGLR
ncbi:hypothetical protein JP74_12505 [Devosia sp. 17-2-E-8]|nr:hypothetical protein JP74_12505 [Devosia sp. 17-2-E-8]